MTEMPKSKITPATVAIGAGIVGVGAATWYLLRKKDDEVDMDFVLDDMNVLPVTPGSTYSTPGPKQPAAQGYQLPYVPPVTSPAYVPPPIQAPAAKVVPQGTMQQDHWIPPENRTAQPDDRSGMGEPTAKTDQQLVSDTVAETQLALQQQQAKIIEQQRAAMVAAVKAQLQKAYQTLLGKGWVKSPVQKLSLMVPIDEAKYRSHATEIIRAFGLDPESKKPLIGVELGAHKQTGQLVASVSDATGLTKFSVVIAKPKFIVPEVAPVMRKQEPVTASRAVPPATSVLREQEQGGFEDQIAPSSLDQEPAAAASPNKRYVPTPMAPTTSSVPDRNNVVAPSVSQQPKTPVEVLKEAAAQFRSIGLTIDRMPPWARMQRVNPREVAAEWMKVRTLTKKYNLDRHWRIDVGGVDGDKANVRYIFTLHANPKIKVVLKRG